MVSADASSDNKLECQITSRGYLFIRDGKRSRLYDFNERDKADFEKDVAGEMGDGVEPKDVLKAILAIDNKLTASDTTSILERFGEHEADCSFCEYWKQDDNDSFKCTCKPISILYNPCPSFKANTSKFQDENGRIMSPIIADLLLTQNRRYVRENGAFRQILHSYYTENDVLYVFDWDEGIYVEATEQVRAKVAKWLGDEANKHRTEEVIYNLKSKTCSPKIPSLPIRNVLVKNGLLDIESCRLNQPTPEFFNTIKLPIKYDAEADCPRFKKFLAEVLDVNDIPVMQEWFGYCLQRDYRHQKAMMLIGDGENGKSVLINVLKTFLDPKNVSNVNLQDLSTDRFALASLHNKLANLYPDIPAKALTETGSFKALTGGDQIEAQHKFGRRFGFTNHAKLMFSTNTLPQTRDQTNAFYRRWLLITFKNTFPIGDPRRDPHLLQKLTTEEELSGILNWAIEGLRRLNNNGQFSYGRNTDDIQEQYIRLSNPVQAYVQDRLDPDAESQIVKDDLFNDYIQYCKLKKLPATAKNIFAKELARYIPVSSTRINIAGKRTNAWIGIKIKEVDESENGQLKTDVQSETPTLVREVGDDGVPSNLILNVSVN